MSLAGTPDSMAAMVMLWTNGWVTDAEMDSWTRSLAFQKQPTPQMLISVAVSTCLLTCAVSGTETEVMSLASMLSPLEMCHGLLM